MLSDISYDVVVHTILPFLHLDDIYELRNRYPRAFNESIVIKMKTLEGATVILQLALEKKDNYLLNYVINNICAYSSRSIYERQTQLKLALCMREIPYEEYTRRLEEAKHVAYDRTFDYSKPSSFREQEDSRWDVAILLDKIFIEALSNDKNTLVATMLSGGESKALSLWFKHLPLDARVKDVSCEALRKACIYHRMV